MVGVLKIGYKGHGEFRIETLRTGYKLASLLLKPNFFVMKIR
jgi:hypothetical protein